MRIEKIKLAGFKSFVDPTQIPLPGNLVGIVGPNGCGKSNIIDAVRWVMGESSAKHLRGDTMADVIFNGSATRKPVGWASVELVFDNSEGQAPGEFAEYRQIAIRRQVGRDGQSNYLLNGARCRRKDITDLFLGTGLGARSYAIIEQGTISRLIEAKPDELREIIEEAAGISKYKERRHETEIRMRHTQENLERLEDVRGEVRKHLDSLQRQVKKAERYTALRAEEKAAKIQLLTLRWQKFRTALSAHQADLESQGEVFRQLVSAGRELAARLEEQRELHEERQTRVQATQATFYELGADIGRLDQFLKHAEKSRAEATRELEQIEAELADATLGLEHDEAQIEAVRKELADSHARLPGAAARELDAQRARTLEEQALRERRAELDEARSERARHTSAVDVLRSRLEQTEDRQRQLALRQTRLHAERDGLEGHLEEERIDSLRDEWQEAEAERERVRARLEDMARIISGNQRELKETQESLHAIRAEIHRSQGRLGSLELLQQHAMGKDRAELGEWLRRWSLESSPRLAEALDVQPGWEAALENVLGLHLEALCVATVEPYLPHLEGLAGRESLAMLESRAAEAAPAGEYPRLLDRIDTPWNLGALLGGIYCAPDLPAARRLCRSLREHESVVTPDGTWLGPGWLMIRRPDDGKAGIIRRERELREGRSHLEQLLGQAASAEQRFADLEARLQAAERERGDLQAELRRLDEESLRLKGDWQALTARSEEARRRMAQLDADLKEIDEEMLALSESRVEFGQSLAAAGQAVAQLEEQLRAMAERVSAQERECAAAESRCHSARDELRVLEGRIETLTASEDLTVKHLERARMRHAQTLDRRESLRGKLAEDAPSLEDDRSRLELLRQERQSLEDRLAEERRGIAELESAIRAATQARMRNEHQIEEVKSRIERSRIDLEGDHVRLQGVLEQFDALGITPEAGLPDDATGLHEGHWQQRLTQLADDLEKLGAVNLAAVEEFREEQARLDYLDEQHRDLSESLATLQLAIEKIDRECRALFKDTFERIDSGFRKMFPKLFGGGNACLELNERDLLEAGVSVMARPPGKRNSSIHLLSGGEKALTAVALVFAIFELNPAPFCLLDEVDAPLDDANVGRFCGLVKEMSEKVQFLFITHNKVTMEIAKHLAGVTMKEPGVSRIVAVDIEEAVELAAV